MLLSSVWLTSLSVILQGPSLWLPVASFHVFLWLSKGDGIPLQYSCLENPMDRGAWWAAVHGVAKSRT